MDTFWGASSGASIDVIEEPDDELVLAAQAGDREAMTAILTEWNDPVFGFLMRRLGNRADAEDAAQETFVRIVKGLGRYEHRGQFRAWVFRIARNQAALTATRRGRVGDREVGMESAGLEALGEEQEDDGVERLERAEALRRAIEALPEAEREVVLMRVDDDLKFREIAERTGVSLNTVLGRMRNATRRLREKLERVI
ncbi:MAG: sigma-70 family RNA polymerase sigma factor [Verrucomicrobiota bacterium]